MSSFTAILPVVDSQQQVQKRVCTPNSPATTELDLDSDSSGQETPQKETHATLNETPPKTLEPENSVKEKVEEDTLLAMLEEECDPKDFLQWGAEKKYFPPTPSVQEKQVADVVAIRQWVRSADLDHLDFMKEAVSHPTTYTERDLAMLDGKSSRIDLSFFGQHTYSSLVACVHSILSSGITGMYIGLARDIWHRWCKMSNRNARHHLHWQCITVLCCTDVTHARWCERALLREFAAEPQLRNSSGGGEISREGSDDVWIYACVNFSHNLNFDFGTLP